MSSSNWHQPTVDDDWEPCSSGTTSISTTPPPQYSPLRMVDNAGIGSSNAIRQEIVQEQRDMDLENDQFRPTKSALSWFEKIWNRISVRNFCKQISNCMTFENIFRSFGMVMMCLGVLTAIVVGAVLAWDLVIYVVVNRTRACSKTD